MSQSKLNNSKEKFWTDNQKDLIQMDQ
jgi:hypothetical protein